MIRGTDVWGSQMMQALAGIGEALGQSIQKKRRDEEVKGIMTDLTNTVDPAQTTTKAGAPAFIDSGIEDISNTVPRSPFDPRNAEKLGRLAELAPHQFAALQSTKPTYFNLGQGDVRFEQSSDGKTRAIASGFPPATKASTLSNDWQGEFDAQGNPVYGKVPGTGKVEQKQFKYQISPVTGKLEKIYKGMEGTVPNAMSQPPLQQGALELAYEAWKTSGKTPTLGRNYRAQTQMWNYFGDRAKAEGLTGMAIEAQRASYDSKKTALALVEKQGNTAEPIAKALYANMDNVKKELLQGGYTPPTDSPLLNDFWQWSVQGKVTGDPKLQKYKTLIYPVVREYAKLSTGAHGSVGEVSVSGVERAAELLNPAMNVQAVLKALEGMRADSQNLVDAWKNEAKALKAEISIPAGGEVPKEKIEW